jgi:hypothetical protein
LQASPETVAAFLPAAAHGNLAVKTGWLRQAVIRYLHLFRDQARALSPVKENTALVLDRLRSALLTIPDTLPGLQDRAYGGRWLDPGEIALSRRQHRFESGRGRHINQRS